MCSIFTLLLMIHKEQATQLALLISHYHQDYWFPSSQSSHNNNPTQDLLFSLLEHLLFWICCLLLYLGKKCKLSCRPPLCFVNSRKFNGIMMSIVSIINHQFNSLHVCSVIWLWIFELNCGSIATSLCYQYLIIMNHEILTIFGAINIIILGPVHFWCCSILPTHIESLSPVHKSPILTSTIFNTKKIAP